MALTQFLVIAHAPKLEGRIRLETFALTHEQLADLHAFAATLAAGAVAKQD